MMTLQEPIETAEEESPKLTTRMGHIAANWSLKDMPKLLDKQGNATIEVWDLWRCISIGARRYLIARAENPFFDREQCCAEANVALRTMEEYRLDYPGFRELEVRLQDEPLLAVHFLAVIRLPTAMKHFNKVLEGKEKGSAEQSARYIANISHRGNRERPQAPAASSEKQIARSLLEGIPDDE